MKQKKVCSAQQCKEHKKCGPKGMEPLLQDLEAWEVFPRAAHHRPLLHSSSPPAPGAPHHTTVFPFPPSTLRLQSPQTLSIRIRLAGFPKESCWCLVGKVSEVWVRWSRGQVTPLPHFCHVAKGNERTHQLVGRFLGNCFPKRSVYSFNCY